MENCKKLIDECMKNTRSNYQKKMIRKCRKSYQKHPTTLERWNLCMHYSIICSVPFSTEPNPIYKLCEKCSEKKSSEEVFTAIHSGKEGEVVWGMVRYIDK